MICCLISVSVEFNLSNTLHIYMCMSMWVPRNPLIHNMTYMFKGVSDPWSNYNS